MNPRGLDDRADTLTDTAERGDLVVREDGRPGAVGEQPDVGLPAPEQPLGPIGVRAGLVAPTPVRARLEPLQLCEVVRIDPRVRPEVLPEDPRANAVVADVFGLTRRDDELHCRDDLLGAGGVPPAQAPQVGPDRPESAFDPRGGQPGYPGTKGASRGRSRAGPSRRPPGGRRAGESLY